MGINYTFSLVYGFEILEDEVAKPFLKFKKYPGKSHFERRFNQLTGEEIDRVEVWDEKPYVDSWYEIDGKVYDDLDPEEFDDILAKKFNCYVDSFGDFSAGKFVKILYVNKITDCANYYGNIIIYNNEIKSDDIMSLTEKANELWEKLKAFGYNVQAPKIFIASRIG